MYDPTIGQFLSEDPTEFEAGDPNLKRMVGNNLPNRTDPLGLEATPLIWTAPPIPQIDIQAPVFAQAPGKVSFETVKQVEDELNKSPEAAKLLAELKEKGLEIVIDQTIKGAGADRARYDIYGNDEIGIVRLNNQTIQTISGAAGYLLLELIRAKNRAEQIALDQKVKSGEIKTTMEYATKCEERTFAYVKELVRIAKEAMEKHGLGPKGDIGWGAVLADIDTFEEYLAWAKGSGHYNAFLPNFDAVKKLPSDQIR